MSSIELLETARLRIQSEVDGSRSQKERNQLGQFATPPSLALDVLACAGSYLGSGTRGIRFLDPAFGTGSFYSALRRTFSEEQILSAVGCEIDAVYGGRADELWRDSGLQLVLADFTKLSPPADDNSAATLIICNPPYVRHHHLEGTEKLRLQAEAFRAAGVKISGLAGLYCFFLCISHRWLSSDGLAGWLIPSEFMDVNYGRAIKEYLLRHVTLLRIHRFDPDDVQFSDALVSSAVVWFRKKAPPIRHTVEFTFGGTLLKPAKVREVSASALKRAAKWTHFPVDSEPAHGSAGPSARSRLGDYFDVKRGIATGANSFFVLSPDVAREYSLPGQFLKPILPSPRYLEVDEVQTCADGTPMIDRRLFLLDCNLPEAQIRALYPGLWEYLQRGVEQGIRSRYLCRHRTPWYAQEQRPAPSFLCTYMGRSAVGRGTGKRDQPFRFILNHSRATAANVYLLLYPKTHVIDAIRSRPALARDLWLAFREWTAEVLIHEGRVYGGGLYKMEPRELANAPADRLTELLPCAPP